MSFAVTSVAIAAVGAGVAAYGAVQQGKAASASADYQAQVARQNQQIADQNAQFALQQGEQQVNAKQQQTAETISAQRAITAAGGIDPNQGSSARIQGDTAALGALDAATIRNNAQRSAYGFQTQGMNFADNAALLSQQSSNASSAGALGAFSSIVGGASSVSSKWNTFQQQGAFVDPWAG